ncbi:MAG: DUF364 domain-containing protein [Pseudomonadota bacterium]|nr:DUF364 domain-containing protein [Pseudomonadota bacterium]
MSLADDFLYLIDAIDRRIALPPIVTLYLPEPMDDPDRVAAFGAMLLEDRSCGFFSAWLGETIADLEGFDEKTVLGHSPAEIARWYAESNPIRRALGFAAANAISQHLFRISGYSLDTTTNSMGELDFQPGDHVGMVGFFPPLVKKLTARGIDLTIIEKQEKFAGREGNYRISFNASDLGNCNKVLCTASTLLNHTVEEILAHCNPAARVALIGPTAGCLPDPLFDRGVDILGGSVAVNAPLLMQRLQSQEKWGESVDKYCIRQAIYPGYKKLLSETSRKGRI